MNSLKKKIRNSAMRLLPSNNALINIKNDLGLEVQNQQVQSITNVVGEFFDANTTQSQTAQASATKQHTQSNKIIVALVCVCTLLLVSLSVVLGYGFIPMPLSDSYVTLNLNCSVEIVADQQDKVKQVNAINGDGAKLLYGMNLKNNPLSTVCSSIVDEAIKLNYISSSDSINIMAINQNVKKEKQLKSSLKSELQSKYNSLGFQVELLDDNMSNFASNLTGVSPAKKALINLVSQKINVSANKLKNYTNSELYKILSDYSENEIIEAKDSIQSIVNDNQQIKIYQEQIDNLKMALFKIKRIEKALDKEQIDKIIEEVIIFNNEFNQYAYLDVNNINDSDDLENVEDYFDNLKDNLEDELDKSEELLEDALEEIKQNLKK